MKRSISFLIPAILIVIIVAVAMLSAGVYYAVTKKEIQKEYTISIDALQAQVANSLAHPMWNFDRPTVKDICRAFLKNELIRTIRVKLAEQ